MKAEIEAVEPSERRKLLNAFILAALGSIPWVGGYLSAAAAFKFDEADSQANALRTQWLEEHHRRLMQLNATLNQISDRFEQLGDTVDARLRSEEYLGVVRKAFRAWDQADTDEKRRLISNLITNAAGTRICSDDILRLFLDWLELYHEVHFAVIKQIFENPGLTRFDIWSNIYGAVPREDSAEADLFKMLIRDLSTGGVIRQEKDINRLGQFLKKRPQHVRKGMASPVAKSAFDGSEHYVLTALGAQFVHYTMNELVARLSAEATPAENAEPPS